MITNPISRRQLLLGASTAIVSSGLVDFSAPSTSAAVPKSLPANPAVWRYCLNTSTINGSSLSVEQQISLTAEAGFDGIELWLRDIQRFVEQGGKLSELRRMLDDSGLTLESAIAFGAWIAEDEARRREGLEQCRRDMETLRELGGTRIAAPPAGATQGEKLSLDAIAERYATLLEVGRSVGVVPMLELWGFSVNLATLPEILYVAAAANDADACLLLDVYHLYKGGSDFQNIGLVPAAKMPCLHINDYPATPSRSEIRDQDRVYPGDGVAPLTHILQSLAQGGFRGVLSLELFNRSYWQQAPEQVARTGLEKMKRSVAAAFAEDEAN
ncbi:MAG: xylose isomerase [Pirellulaceae bacterium]|nr:MAG: xylose isomerase [Pirellulaceae bacterium]